MTGTVKSLFRSIRHINIPDVTNIAEKAAENVGVKRYIRAFECQNNRSYPWLVSQLLPCI